MSRNIVPFIVAMLWFLFAVSVLLYHRLISPIDVSNTTLLITVMCVGASAASVGGGR